MTVNLIAPAHEQLWPTKVLPHRLQEYVRSDGPPSTDRQHARFLSGRFVLAAAQTALAVRTAVQIDPRYFVGTCFHEAGCENEWDTEIATRDCPHGFMSVGAYQIGQEEAARFGYSLADMLELDKATDCMVQLAEENRKALLEFVGQVPFQPHAFDYVDAKGKTWVAGGLRAYLAIAHNHGLGFARTTIVRYGLDWARYKARNPTDKIVTHGYGDDCVDGGSQWPPET